MSLAAREYQAVQRASAPDPVLEHAELVRRIAHHLAARLPASVDVDDLIQAGMIGLIEASRSYDADQGASFETYASIRIRGAMIDEIRRGDWVPRSVHRRARAAAAAIREIEQETGRPASAQEVAERLELPLADYMRLLEDASRGHVLSLDSHVEDHGESEPMVEGRLAAPHEVAIQGEFGRELATAIDADQEHALEVAQAGLGHRLAVERAAGDDLEVHHELPGLDLGLLGLTVGRRALLGTLLGLLHPAVGLGQDLVRLGQLLLGIREAGQQPGDAEPEAELGHDLRVAAHQPLADRADVPQAREPRPSRHRSGVDRHLGEHPGHHQRRDHHGGGVPGREPFHEGLGAGLVVLGVLHPVDDPGEGGVGTDADGLDTQDSRP